MRKIIPTVIIICIFCLLIPKSAAASSKGETLYDKVKQNSDNYYDEVMSAVEEDGTFHDFEYYESSFWNGLVYTYEMLRLYYIPILFVSIILGIFLLVFASKNKRLQKIGLFGFIIFIPLVVTFVVFFLPSVMEKFISM